MNFAVRCETSQAVKTAVRAGLGIGILFQDAVAVQLAKGNFKLVNVPDLRKMGIKSVIAYDRRKPLSSIAQEFLTLLRQRAKRVKARS
jgi:DNA-binding transcriptional LysR family regulator